MNQRGPRLGGIVDDYCPRERRVTDHAVVAMVEDTIKQTRCTTCDDEHPYKQAKVPSTRKRKASLFEQVLDSRSDAIENAAGASAPAARLAASRQPPGTTDSSSLDAGRREDDADGFAADRDDDDIDQSRVHRQLIRATLPRPEGQVQARPLPEFTIRQSGGFNGNREPEPRRPQRSWHGLPHESSGNAPPGNRRPGGPRPPRHGEARFASGGNGGQPSGNAGQPGGRFKSRSRRRHAGKNRTK